MTRTRQLHLDESTLNADGIDGERRFDLRCHRVAPGVAAEAQVITITIEGECRVVKSMRGHTTEVRAPADICIHAAMNGGFVVRDDSHDARTSGRVVSIIAACSDLSDLLSAIGILYTREAVVSGDVDLSGEDPDFAEVGEERAATDGAADAAINDTFYYVLVSGPQSDPEKNVTVFYDEDSMKRAMELVWSAGGKAWARPARLI